MIDFNVVNIRPANKSDYGFILKSISVEFHKLNPTNQISNELFFPKQKKIIDSLLNKCGATILHITDEPDTIVGFIICEPLDQDTIIVHYSAVKGIFRRMGFFNNLLESVNGLNKIIVYTHDFHLLSQFKKKYQLIYNPYLLQDHNG